MGLLSLAIWTPIFFGVVLLALGRDDQARATRWMALIGAIVSFLITLAVVDAFRLGTSAMQMVEQTSWISRFNVNYHLGVDGISLWFVPLTAFITVVVVISAFSGLIAPGLQGLMTRRVGPSEQGQLQGANQALMGLASVIGPSLFGLSFAWTVRAEGPPGLPLFLAAAAMLGGLILALRVTPKPVQAS